MTHGLLAEDEAGYADDHQEEWRQRENGVVREGGAELHDLVLREVMQRRFSDIANRSEAHVRTYPHLRAVARSRGLSLRSRRAFRGIPGNVNGGRTMSKA